MYVRRYYIMEENRDKMDRPIELEMLHNVRGENSLFMRQVAPLRSSYPT